MTIPFADAVRAPYGALLLVAPARVLSAMARAPLDAASLRVARVLGARHLVQAALVASHPTPAWQLGGAAGDAAHAASMLALASWSQRPLHRRLARRNAATAALFAAAGALAAVGGLRGRWRGSL